MNWNKLMAASAAMLLFIQCDPTKKLNNSADYTGSIDTTSIDQYGEYDYGDYSDEAYSYEDSYAEEPVSDVSPWSTELYRATTTNYHDLIHTKLEVRFDWPKAWMYGKATLTLKPYFYPTSTLVLDAKGMDFHEISMVSGNTKTPLTYTYDSMQVSINLGKEYKKEETYTIFIDYTARPNDLPEGGSAAITGAKGLYFINNEGLDANKPMQIWTQGETEASSCWFPTIDKPNQNTTQEIFITVEDKYNTLSNGALISSKKNADGTRTDYWKMDQPHAPYLFMMAIGEYAIVKDNWKGKEVNYYVEKKYEPYARDIFGNTPEMMTLYSNLLGVSFPWNKYSQVVVRDYVSGAMENTTATVHGEFLQQTDRELLDETWEDVVSHELFHQWFGDYVTTESWSNLPLNESFATYGEYLWREYKYGRQDADDHLRGDFEAYMYESESKQVDMIRFNYENKEDMFDSHSYAKGGCILHMLRKYTGDEAFFASLNKYLTDHAHQPVEIHNLRLAFEAVTGEDLNWFFNQWFLGSGHPDIFVSKSYDAATGMLTLQVSQEQYAPTPTYILPVDIDIYVHGKPERHRIVIDRRDQEFSFAVAAQPDLVIFDAENQLLATITEDKSLEEYVFQYTNSPMFLDRYKAVQYLAAEQSYDERAKAIVLKALNDPFWSIRQFAVDTMVINTMTTPAEEAKIMAIANSDPKSLVRASAVARLTQLPTADILPALDKALNDSSYTVIGAALGGIMEKDPVKALEAARRYQNENNINLLVSVWSILAEEGNPKDNDYFLEMFKKYTTWETYYIMIYYQQFLQQQSDISILKKGVDQFKAIALDDSGNWVSFFAGSFLNGIYEYFSQEINNQDAATQTAWTTAMEYIVATQQEIDNSYNEEY
jgi:aminopeptidase N